MISPVLARVCPLSARSTSFSIALPSFPRKPPKLKPTSRGCSLGVEPSGGGRRDRSLWVLAIAGSFLFLGGCESCAKTFSTGWARLSSGEGTGAGFPVGRIANPSTRPASLLDGLAIRPTSAAGSPAAGPGTACGGNGCWGDCHHQLRPISRALSTEAISSRIWMLNSSMSQSLILMSPAITTPLSSTRSRMSARPSLWQAVAMTCGCAMYFTFLS